MRVFIGRSPEEHADKILAVEPISCVVPSGMEYPALTSEQDGVRCAGNKKAGPVLDGQFVDGTTTSICPWNGEKNSIENVIADISCAFLFVYATTVEFNGS